jgi:hypothetical protein
MFFLIKKSLTWLANQIAWKPSEFSSEFQLTTRYILLFFKKYLQILKVLGMIQGDVVRVSASVVIYCFFCACDLGNELIQQLLSIVLKLDTAILGSLFWVQLCWALSRFFDIQRQLHSPSHALCEKGALWEQHLSCIHDWYQYKNQTM